MKKYCLLFFCFLSLCFLTPLQIHAVSTSKETFPYEIQSIIHKNNTIIIDGWGLLNAIHHHNSVNTHYYELILKSESETRTYRSEPHYSSQTEMMKLKDVRRCEDNEYFKNASICYYDYNYTGFHFEIPFSDLKQEETYQATLKISSNVKNIYEITYVFFPSLSPIKKIIGNLEYKVTSNLFDTKLRVIAEAVFERTEPGKNGNIRQSSNICNYTYGYNRFFKPGTVFTQIFDKKATENTTFYKVRTSSSTTCLKGRNVSVEGDNYDSWIASNFVDFAGETLQVSVKDVNQPPTINIKNHPQISSIETSSFNFKDYIEAIDPEEGNITEKTYILNPTDISKEGSYELYLEVKDAYGKKANETLVVTVIKGNVAPVIFADHKTIYQYENFDYLENVRAIDEEDGDLSNRIAYDGFVNTSILGKYNVNYKVMDNQGEMTQKSISITVIRNPKEKIRYISKKENKLFYREDIPINWRLKINYLKEQLNTPKIFSKRHLIIN